MHVFFANPEPSFLVADRLTADFANPIDHAPASLKFTLKPLSCSSYPEQDKTGSLGYFANRGSTSDSVQR